MERTNGLGWLPDVAKPNDYTDVHPKVAPLLEKTRLAGRTGVAGATAQAAIPPKVDLRGGFSPVEDQGYLGSCTANAAVGLLEYFERRAAGK